MLLAFCTNSKILDTVDSPNSFVTFTLITPVKLITPANISSFNSIFLGNDSPVKADVSKEEFPSITIPSKGTLSPGLITIISSILISLGSTFFSSPSVIKFA